jgi:hypothetical protein
VLVIEFTDWAKDILGRSQAAARRFNPDAKIRLAHLGGQVQAQLTDRPADDDQVFDLDGVTVYVESGLEGLVDIEEPHDRPVLKPLGAPWNDRGAHGG